MTISRQVVIEMNADDVRRELQLIRSTVEQTAQTITSKLDGSLKRLGNQLTKTEVGLRRTGQAARAAGSGMGLFNRNSEIATRRLANVAAGAQGVMIGMSLLQRNLTGVGFGLIFLQFSIFKVAAAIAALTLVIGGSAGLIIAFSKLQKAALSAGNALQQIGQRLTNFFRSTKTALDILRQADEVARRFGTDRAKTIESLDLLEQVRLRNSTVIRAVLNTAAATGKEMNEVTERLVDLSRASADEIGNLMQKFARDFDIPMRQYRSAIEIATALNERFAGSAALMAETNVALAQRVANTWRAVLTAIGTVTVNFIQPILKVVLAFTDALLEAFVKARNAAREAGAIADVVGSIREAAQRLIPVVVSLGRWLGTVLFSATLRAGRGLKVLIDITRGFITRVKDAVDKIRGLVQEVKSIANPLEGLALAFKNPALAAGIAVALRTIILGALKTIFTGNISSIFKAAFSGIASGIATGLLLALVGALGNLGIGLLPVQDKIKEVLRDALQIGLAAGVVAAVLGIPILLSVAIITAIIAAIELVLPGTIDKLKELGKDVINSIVEGMKTVRTAIEDEVVPALERVGEAIVTKIGPVIAKFVGWVKDDLMPQLNDLADVLINGVVPAVVDVATAVDSEGIPVWRKWLSLTKELAFWIGEKLLTLLQILGGFVKKQVLESWGPLKRIWADILFILRPIVGLTLALTEAFLDLLPPMKDIGDFLDREVNAQLEILRKGLDLIPNLMGLVALAFSAGITPVRLLISAIEDLIALIKSIPTFDLPGLPSLPGLGDFGKLDPRRLIPQSFSDLNPFSGALGGIVPGRLGQRVPVLAEAGERFGGAPMLERARPGGGGGGGGVTVVLDLRNSVIASDRAVDELAAKIGRKLFGRQSNLRSMTQHRP